MTIASRPAKQICWLDTDGMQTTWRTIHVYVCQTGVLKQKHTHLLNSFVHKQELEWFGIQMSFRNSQKVIS